MNDQVYIGVGSNIDPEINIPEGLRLLAERVRIVALSTFYYSDPVDRPGQPRFVNGVCRIQTELEPRALKFDVLRPIERQLGRIRSADKSAPRTLDLDILLFGDRVELEEDLIIPDPELLERPFLFGPLLELSPGHILPGDGRRIDELVSPAQLNPAVELTARLRL